MPVSQTYSAEHNFLQPKRFFFFNDHLFLSFLLLNKATEADDDDLVATNLLFLGNPIATAEFDLL